MQDFRPSRFQVLPPVVKNLMIISVLVYLAQVSLPNVGVNTKSLFSLHTWQSQEFRPWQIITHGFINERFIGLTRINSISDAIQIRTGIGPQKHFRNKVHSDFLGSATSFGLLGNYPFCCKRSRASSELRPSSICP